MLALQQCVEEVEPQVLLELVKPQVLLELVEQQALLELVEQHVLRERAFQPLRPPPSLVSPAAGRDG